MPKQRVNHNLGPSSDVVSLLAKVHAEAKAIVEDFPKMMKLPPGEVVEVSVDVARLTAVVVELKDDAAQPI